VVVFQGDGLVGEAAPVEGGSPWEGGGFQAPEFDGAERLAELLVRCLKSSSPDLGIAKSKIFHRISPILGTGYPLLWPVLGIAFS
jgi:hypothetical protein